MHYLRLILTFASLCFIYAAARPQNPYKIPVVVHVIHSDGGENITDAQVKNGIGILTRNWRKQNPDTAEIVSVFKPLAADMGVEFELAKFDPDGHCTNGINRIRSEFTLTGTHNVKSLVHWPPDRYLNIYVVRNAAGLAGHALMPSQADSVPAWDGIVISGGYFGNIGTSNDTKSVVLSHEVGHYLNLFHIWGGNNVPGFYYLPVGQAANCAVGDSVADTPRTVGWSTCNLNGVSCDAQPDNVQNFMDYAYCARMFTHGQKQRVHAALNSPVAGRNRLWTAQNLAVTGLSVDAPLCRADFYSPRRTYCVGETIPLYDASYHDPVSWNWDMGDGVSLAGSEPTHAYTQPGKYTVGLHVSDGSAQMDITKPAYFHILASTGLPLPYVEGFETLSDLSGSALFTECEGSLCFTLQNGPAASGQQSVRVENGNGPADLLYRVTTPRLDFSQTPDPVIRFRYAFARKDTQNTDKLIVKISKDCGQTWQVRKTVLPAEMATVNGTVAGPFTPQAADWKEVMLTGIPPTYKTDNVLVRIEFYSGGGNHFYLDDINVFDLSTLSVTDPGTAEWFAAPNPASGEFRVEGPFADQRVELFSMDGKRVFLQERLPTGRTVSVSALPAGLYQLKMTHAGTEAWRKLVVVHP